MDASALASAESWLYWIGVAKLGGAFLVAAGVVLEFGGDWISRPYEKVVNAARATELANLQQGTAKANAEAEQARLELAKFRSPRLLSQPQQAALEAIAAVHKGLGVHIFMAGDSGDIRPLSDSFAQLFNAAGWKAAVWTWTGVGPLEAVAVLVKKDATKDSLAAANEIAGVLGGQGTKAHVWGGDWASFGGMLNGPHFDAKDAEIRLVVGSKPM